MVSENQLKIFVTNRTFSNRDCKTIIGTQKHFFRRGHLHILAVASGLLGVVALFGPSDEAAATRNPTLVTPRDAGPVTLPLILPDAVAIPAMHAEPVESHWRTITVQKGDNLSLIFARVGLGPGIVNAVMSSGDAVRPLKSLKPGHLIQIDLTDGYLQGLRYELGQTKTLIVSSRGTGFSAVLEERAVETRVNHVFGVIESSLFLAGRQAGLSDNLVMELAGIFGWDIDFALDIRKGDSFSVLFEERFVGGEKLGNGAIVAAEFVNQGNAYQAVRFVDSTGRAGYYSPDGASMRKAFLRTPVDFRRISSSFQPERHHPVLGVKRPHRGVDYAASIGTPIRAAGDGKIDFIGTKGGYGRTIIIQHGGRYSTLYAHMSRYNKGLRAGTKVRQGQTIGYVGKSGLATGPHLHYEFRVNGAHRNPLTVRLPNAAPLSAEYHKQFAEQAGTLLTQLELMGRAQLVAGRP